MSARLWAVVVVARALARPAESRFTNFGYDATVPGVSGDPERPAGSGLPVETDLARPSTPVGSSERAVRGVFAGLVALPGDIDVDPVLPADYEVRGFHACPHGIVVGWCEDCDVSL